MYARGVHVVAVAGEMATAAVGAGGARGVRRIETAVEELGVKPPVVSTRAVCTAWLKLREEVTEMLELRKALAKRREELCGTTPASEAAAAAAPRRGCRGGVPAGWPAGHAPVQGSGGDARARRTAHRREAREARAEEEDAREVRGRAAVPAPPQRREEGA